MANGRFYDLNRITHTAGNYGPKLYFLENESKFVLVWHHVDRINRTRKIRVSSVSENFINWSKPIEFGVNADNCYPSHVIHNNEHFIAFSSGDALYKKNKALFISPMNSPEEVATLDLGVYPNLWRSDIIYFQGKYYCSFETPHGLIVKSSLDLTEWSEEIALDNTFVRPRLSLSQDSEKLFMSFECINTNQGIADIGFMTILSNCKTPIYWITSDSFDNTRPSSVQEIGKDEYQIFYTSNYKGLECLMCSKFRIKNGINHDNRN